MQKKSLRSPLALGTKEQTHSREIKGTSVMISAALRCPEIRRSSYWNGYLSINTDKISGVCFSPVFFRFFMVC